MLTLQQIATQYNVKVINSTASTCAFNVQACVNVQNAVNAQLYSNKQKSTAKMLQQALSTMLNSNAYVNLRKRFIAIKVSNCLYKLNTKKLQTIFTLCKQHNAQFVLTKTNSIILRLK
jgi:hypothetical protein